MNEQIKLANKTSARELCRENSYDAIVIGSGPNGVSAAILFAQKGMKVLLLEAKDTIGGGCRSAEVTLPGFIHDLCSSIHPLGLGSPFFRTLNLEKFGLTWCHPEACFAHPLDGGTSAAVYRSIEQTVETLDLRDGAAYSKLMNSTTPNWEELCEAALNPLNPLKMFRHPVALVRFGLRAMMSAHDFTNTHFRSAAGRALMAGVFAHANLPFSSFASASFGLALTATAHAVGWPAPQGGAQSLMNALVELYCSLGGEVITSCSVGSLDDLPDSKIVMFDTSPSQLVQIAGKNLPTKYVKKLVKFKHGPGVFKLDHALSAPIPWAAQQCSDAGTVHLGGTYDEIAQSELDCWNGKYSEQPYVLLVQSANFDSSRAPQGKYTCWAYCHVPNGSQFDMTSCIENQIERFAPGFKQLILKRHITTPASIQAYNPNYIGGDINGGAFVFNQILTRPVARLVPYATPAKGLYLCSASTPPGGGVHGMSGYYAAQAAIRGWR